ncbi:metal-dependent hydrolase [Haloarcula sp. GH36]|uniref:metal-dependent hydrolase n=1 Tax=Haloarcula montana TaxID=3111776 RepID=UPI002D76AD89|nr:metal-dependent hydrolase [Haloarcula sp. GH36]
MWPWGHAAVGYIAYSLYVRRDGRRPTAVAVVALAIGTQFPDLVDKPLGWTLGILPGGRTLAHSLLTFAVVGVAVLYVARHYRQRPLGVAFLIGYLSHTLSDGLYAAIDGEFADLTYLLWPVLPMPEYETEQSFLAHFQNLALDSTVTFEFGLVALAAILWILDGYPMLSAFRTAIRDRFWRTDTR